MKRFGWVHFAQTTIAFLVITSLLVAALHHFGIGAVSPASFFLALLYLGFELAILKVLVITDTTVTLSGSNIFKRPVSVVTTDIIDVYLKSGRVVTEVIINMKNGRVINRNLHLTKRELLSLIDSLHDCNITVRNTPYKKIVYEGDM